ncbi:glycoside hydrolase family 3 C-terminal domain-containing protein [Caldibacillus lycopersici]|uniref:beta-glucosidase n=1 Tax=Perspicuibacillus lycopersici TaxID=1325689 RepID=A0AAE3IRU5_9BACI|nr:glycoside hydrolase family 3 N-terminal domain-containing protein [Perspicuibacillus lycopersici]MCU9613052.1 glycoside hydrolase family 3 C-terminal domain-containing protein [Perspicuibacillus lycopersici]
MENQQLLNIIDQLTLKEKIAQLIQLSGVAFDAKDSEITGPLEEMNMDLDTLHHTGSVLGISGASEVIKLQKEYLKHNRHGIPLLFMADVIHGYKTIFPIPLGIGATWDLNLAEKSAEVAALETAVSGVHVTFAPMVDLVRDPRWGRVMESTGEDPFLNSEFARAFVRGFQGKDLTNDVGRVAACVKHFAAYGAPEGGRDYNTVNMSERQMREHYLPAYKAGLDEGAELIMTSFNTVDGIPASANKHLMKDILREEWGFQGVLISDWGAVKELIPHGVAEDEKEAAYKAMRAGVDIEMMSPCYVHHLEELVQEGSIEEAEIDQAVLRVLQLKDKLGLFENPYRGADELREKEVVLSAEHRKAAREVAAKSFVLLKNQNQTLPLQRDKKLALIGPFAKSKDILGSWSWLGAQDQAVSIFDGFVAKTDVANLVVAQGCEVETSTAEMLAEAIETAKNADIIVLALGEAAWMSGESNSRASIQLPAVQLELVKQIKALNKPIVTILFNGRPLDLHGVFEESDAILDVWFPGTEGGNAICDVLFGDVNPSGKLTMSFPYSVGQIPVYYNHFNTGRPQSGPYGTRYLDIPIEPLLPFGFGLSYTTFTYSEMQVTSTVLTKDNPIQIQVDVTNSGELAGEEIVQFYIRDIAGEIVRPVKELKAFEKVSLQPGERKTITFTLTEEQLRYYHSDLQWQSDPGTFELFVGPNSRDVQSIKIILK